MHLRYEHTRRLLRIAQEAGHLTDHAARTAHVLAGLANVIGAPAAVAVIDEAFTTTPGVRLRAPITHGVLAADRARLVATCLARPILSALARHAPHAVDEQAVAVRAHELIVRTADRRTSAGARHAGETLYGVRVIPPGDGAAELIVLHRAEGDAFTDLDRNLLALFLLEVAPALLDRPPTAVARARRRLSRREREVLAALLRGASEKEVAADLGLTVHTVHQYVKAVYRAFGVGSRGQLLATCLAAGPPMGRGPPAAHSIAMV